MINIPAEVASGGDNLISQNTNVVNTNGLKKNVTVPGGVSIN